MSTRTSRRCQKNLRNTLNADLLYASEDLREQAKALKLVLAQRLGEDKVSPLYGRVQVGEDTKTPLRCLTIDAVARGLDRGGFIGTFTKTEVTGHWLLLPRIERRNLRCAV